MCVHHLVSKHTLRRTHFSVRSDLRKWTRSQTHFKHAHFLSTTLSKWHFLAVAVAAKRKYCPTSFVVDECDVGAVARSCASGGFSGGFLCALCLDCGLLLTSPLLQTHWHVIYGNEPWRKRCRINQTHPTGAEWVCVFDVWVCVWGAMVKAKKQIKKRDRGKVYGSVGSFWLFWCSFMQQQRKRSL